MRSYKKLLPILAALTLASCTTLQEDGPQPEKTQLKFEAIGYHQLPRMTDEAWGPALSAFKRSCVSLRYKEAWKGVCAIAEKMQPADAKSFFISQFVPYRVEARIRDADKKLTVTDQGMMTGYYEPLLYGSRTKTKSYNVPLHSVPDDLITVSLDSLYPQLKGLRLRGKIEGQKLVPYDDRGDLVKRKDLDKWALAWVGDPVEAFFLQVQGSGRIVLPDGSYMRVGYANTNGHPYRAIGQWLIKKGYLQPHELSMQSIRAWAKKNPKRLHELLNQNPSYVFFTERQALSFDEGPIGAQGVPLTAMGSIAVDRRYYQLGWPMVVEVEQENPDMNFVRAVVAQDTGGAIKGPIRYDFFWGFGEEAGELAGRQKSQVKAWVLLPNGVEPPK